MIGQWMKRQVVSVSPATTAPEAARLVVDKHIGTLPVVDVGGILLGVVRVQDLLDVFMPDFVDMLEHIDFVRDFGAMENLEPRDVAEAAGLTMADLMQPPVAVEETSGLLRALATMHKHGIRDLPVVDAAGGLVGIASLVDIAAAFLATWVGEEQAP